MVLFVPHVNEWIQNSSAVEKNKTTTKQSAEVYPFLFWEKEKKQVGGANQNYSGKQVRVAIDF